MKIQGKILNIFRITCTLLALIACFSLAFFFTSFLFNIFGVHPLALIIQILNSFIGLLFIACAIFIKIKHIEPQHGGIFETIIKGIEKIARGDFNVRLDNENDGKGPLGELVKSVNNMAHELSKMEEMRQEFISNVSHEIQSPLTSIRGFAKVLKNDVISSEDRLHYLTIIETESIRLSKLSDDLLKLASLEAETIKFEPKIYRIDKQIKNIILACEPQWMDKNIDMEVCLEEVNIKADEDMLRQVWINLIHNSIKFTPDGGNVIIELHQQGENLELKLSDTGIGIAKEEQIRIFERFYKADRSRVRYSKGNGLGLSIAKRIVDMHNGNIKVQSKLNIGTEFTISLPKGF
jgi:two-component system, OmpR family, phosphate regulon sensor histidine kinase PhoR